MKKTLLSLGALIGGLTLALPLNATPVNGAISFSGTVSFTSSTSSISDATSISFLVGSGITATASGVTATGSYSGVGNDIVTGGLMGLGGTLTFPTFLPNPTTIWSFSDIGTGLTYSFDLDSPITVGRIGGLTLNGTGTAHVTGLANTAGTWSLSSQNGSSLVTFSTTTTVPDSGSTALLIGLGILGLGAAMRQRFSRG